MLTVVCLLALTAGALFVVNRGGSDSPAAQAPGLRGGHLPDGLQGRRAFNFDLPNARGGRVSTMSLAGRPYAITFLFTRCPDICPVIGQQIRMALRGLGPDAARVAAVAVSVDPAGDTPGAVKRWLSRQSLPSNFLYAIGTERQLLPSWEAYYAAPKIAGRPDTTAHAGAVWLVDAKGRLRARYSGDELLDPADLTADLLSLVRESSGTA